MRKTRHVLLLEHSLDQGCFYYNSRSITIQGCFYSDYLRTFQRLLRNALMFQELFNVSKHFDIIVRFFIRVTITIHRPFKNVLETIRGHFKVVSDFSRSSFGEPLQRCYDQKSKNVRMIFCYYCQREELKKKRKSIMKC